MNILLTGAAGQLGSELLPLLSGRGNLTATDRSKHVSSTVNWVEMDIGNGAQLEALLNRLQPALIVNTAAYTAVDQAEADPDTAFEINAELPARLADWSKRNDARLLHYSTDYVFDGETSRPYLETDTPNPQNIYGESKLAGERAIEAAACKHVTLRTSWVYSSHGKNFVLSMLELARKGTSLKVVDDQHGCPTWARNLAYASIAVIDAWQTSAHAGSKGVFHYCDDRSLSWFDFARVIFRNAIKAGILDGEPALAPVPGSEFPQPARRPRCSVLDTGRINSVFGIKPAAFESSLQAVIDEIKTRA